MAHTSHHQVSRNRGQDAYERDVAKVPIMPNGMRRPTWHELPSWAKYSWEKDSTDKPSSEDRNQTITSRQLSDAYTVRGSMPGPLVERLYAIREAEVAALAIRPQIEISDLTTLDRGARFKVAVDLFSLCTPATQLALLADSHHSVRSAAFLAQAGLARIAGATPIEAACSCPWKRPSPLDSIILECLQQNGWSPLDGGALAGKAFMTAVGTKDAHVYLAHFPSAYVLQGEYYSEGGNVCAAHAVTIPKNAMLAEVKRLTTLFVEAIEEAIADSYAARLWDSQVSRVTA